MHGYEATRDAVISGLRQELAAGVGMVEVARVWIIDAGRRALSVDA